MAIDLGHNQYTGRYTRTLKSMQRHMDQAPDPLILLAYWHYEHANRNYLWYEPRDASYVGASTEVIDNGAGEDWVDHLRFTV